MRADRLLSILMLLQTHNHLTAQELADSLEVSPRTIYRDIDALCMAGVPVIADMGPQGGYTLPENYRTELTGLTQGEAGALMLLDIPSPLDALEIGQQLKAALRKLYAALPRQTADARAFSYIHLDWSWWGQKNTVSGSLETLYRAITNGVKVCLTYRMMNGIPFEKTVLPLGLVAKAGAWYCVYLANRKFDTKAVGNLSAVKLTGETFVSPEGFDIKDFWEKTCAETESSGRRFRVTVLANPQALPVLARQQGNNLLSQPSSSHLPGWVRLELFYDSFESARHALLDMGRSVRVLEPEALRLSIIDYASQITSLYQEAEPATRKQNLI